MWMGGMFIEFLILFFFDSIEYIWMNYFFLVSGTDFEKFSLNVQVEELKTNIPVFDYSYVEK